MVECAGGSERAWFFSAEEPSEAGGVLSVPIDVKRTGDKAWIGYNVLDSLMGDD
ncbi:chaperonin [Bifidobacterium breve]|uniref:chaperonin n=1 Tax=Bifidobacterium breve TaxID=1685 RepID=UPI003D036AD1